MEIIFVWSFNSVTEQKRKQNVLEEGILSAPKFLEFEYNYNGIWILYSLRV